MVLLSRLIAASAYAGAAFLFGVALGERGELGFVQYVFTGVIPAAAIVLAIFAKHGRADVFATGIAMLAGLVIGQRQYERAWQDCIARAEIVRTALVARQGDYPPRLEDLGIELPCRCGFRKTILHYLSNDRGFRLWFTNDRETFIATDRIAFSSSGKSSDPRLK